MRIFVITPIYATSTKNNGATPVVHYFAKEWVKLGHEVHVFHLQAKYPKIYYWIGRKWQHQINTKLGMLIPIEIPVRKNETIEGVDIHRLTLKKYLPHSRCSNQELKKTIKYISEECDVFGMPDVFIGHWHNPQLEILCSLKELFHIKTVLVLHSNEFDLENFYRDRFLYFINRIDVLGFRSQVALELFKKKCNTNHITFVAPSGVSEAFLKQGDYFSPTFDAGVNSFVFVGSLIKRKYPLAIYRALQKANKIKEGHITYIGDGAEKEIIEKESMDKKNIRVKFTGRIPRKEIVEELKQAQVFVMISKYEVFGLVYLEAMALGLIPIGSRNEGIDGIIKDGVNGFLCTAGDDNELASIMDKISCLKKSELMAISDNAKETARQYSDREVAIKYLEKIN